jgi:hypothetical protein
MIVGAHHFSSGKSCSTMTDRHSSKHVFVTQIRTLHLRPPLILSPCLPPVSCDALIPRLYFYLESHVDPILFGQRCTRVRHYNFEVPSCAGSEDVHQ